MNELPAFNSTAYDTSHGSSSIWKKRHILLCILLLFRIIVD